MFVQNVTAQLIPPLAKMPHSLFYFSWWYNFKQLALVCRNECVNVMANHANEVHDDDQDRSIS